MNETEQKELNLAYLKAAQADQADEVARCLDAGAELYVCNMSNGWSAMHFALACNHPAIVRTLVARGFNPNLGAGDDIGAPILCWALATKKREALDELVRSGADVSRKNKGNKPPLVFRLEENDAFGISYLLNAGADPAPALGYLNHDTDIKWFGERPTGSTVRHFNTGLDARRRREGDACGDVMEHGSAARVTPLKPLAFKMPRVGQ
jgi:hypothetical protein